MGTIEFQQGYNAYCNNQDEAPYAVGSAKFYDWVAGWCTAQGETNWFYE